MQLRSTAFLLDCHRQMSREMRHKKGDRPPGQPPPVKYRKKLFVLSALTASATSATAVTATSSTVVARLLSLSSDTCVR